MSSEEYGMADATRSPRERYREQVRDEIKAHAWEQAATTGPAAISLNAIAKRMGISGPALYRYFRNRDELITDLILDAYRDLSGTLQAAAAQADPTGASPAARLAEAAGAFRRWALEAPHRYLLIYGTPVPGYHAPPEATALAATIMKVLLDAFTDALSAGAGAGAGDADAAAGTGAGAGGAGGSVPEAAAALEQDLAAHRTWAAGHPAPPEALRHALTFWTRLHGVLSLEVAGHFTGMEFDPALLYAAETDAAATMPLVGPAGPGNSPSRGRRYRWAFWSVPRAGSTGTGAVTSTRGRCRSGGGSSTTPSGSPRSRTTARSTGSPRGRRSPNGASKSPTGS
jgi:AcrR family transcriptional regulator